VAEIGAHPRLTGHFSTEHNRLGMFQGFSPDLRTAVDLLGKLSPNPPKFRLTGGYQGRNGHLAG